MRGAEGEKAGPEKGGGILGWPVLEAAEGVSPGSWGFSGCDAVADVDVGELVIWWLGV